MKVIERVFERRIREKVKIDAMQFGFMPWTRASEAGVCRGSDTPTIYGGGY